MIAGYSARSIIDAQRPAALGLPDPPGNFGSERRNSCLIQRRVRRRSLRVRVGVGVVVRRCCRMFSASAEAPPAETKTNTRPSAKPRREERIRSRTGERAWDIPQPVPLIISCSRRKCGLNPNPGPRLAGGDKQQGAEQNEDDVSKRRRS